MLLKFLSERLFGGVDVGDILINVYSVVAPVILFTVFASALLAVTTHVRVPVFTKSQGRETFCGKVTKVKKIGPMTTEVSLEQRMEIDPRLVSGNVVAMSGGITRYIHFSGRQELPQVGDTIEAYTENMLHKLKERSFNWVSSWSYYDMEPPPGAVATLGPAAAADSRI